MYPFRKLIFHPFLIYAGETNLSAKFDVIRVDLQLSEQFKSVSPCFLWSFIDYSVVCKLHLFFIFVDGIGWAEARGDYGGLFQGAGILDIPSELSSLLWSPALLFITWLRMWPLWFLHDLCL